MSYLCEECGAVFHDDDDLKENLFCSSCGGVLSVKENDPPPPSDELELELDEQETKMTFGRGCLLAVTVIVMTFLGTCAKVATERFLNIN